MGAITDQVRVATVATSSLAGYQIADTIQVRIAAGLLTVVGGGDANPIVTGMMLNPVGNGIFAGARVVDGGDSESYRVSVGGDGLINGLDITRVGAAAGSAHASAGIVPTIYSGSEGVWLVDVTANLREETGSNVSALTLSTSGIVLWDLDGDAQTTDDAITLVLVSNGMGLVGAATVHYDWDNDGTLDLVTLSIDLTISGGAVSQVVATAQPVLTALGGRQTWITDITPVLIVPDTVAPVLSGSIDVGALTGTSYTATAPVGTDNIGVTQYRWRINGGTPSIIASGGRSISISGRTPGSSDLVAMAAGDAAGNWSPWLTQSVTLQAPATAILLSGPTEGTVGVPSTFTVTANGVLPTNVTITPLVGNGGAVNPASIQLTENTPRATFTVTAIAAGSASVTITNNASLLNTNSPITWTAIAARTFPTVPTTGTVIATISSPSSGNKPLCFGAAFKQGDYPGTATFTGVQCTAKNLWPDGSLKFAILACGLTATGGIDRPIGLNIGQGPGGSTLTTADLRATGVTTGIDAGTYGYVSWSDIDWDSPFSTWITGPLLSSWTYRKPIGSDPHLVAWLEVRLWLDGSVEVLPWIENGYVMVPGPTTKTATFTCSVGGTQRCSVSISLPHHCRTPLVNGTALSYWLGSDPDVAIKQNAAYMMSSELVPTYRGEQNAAAANSLASSYAPLQPGNLIFDDDLMGSTGYQGSIGLLPQHDVSHLTCPSPLTYGAVIRNGFSAGRYGLYYRDETTQRPIRFSRYPNKVIRAALSGILNVGSSSINDRTPSPSGLTPPQWDIAHSPAMSYMAYLVTGRWYFMEGVQFEATANFLAYPDIERGFSLGRWLPAVTGEPQTRTIAWGFRGTVLALSATPDDDLPLQTEFKTAVQAEVDKAHGRYIAQPSNNFGIIQPGQQYGTGGFGVEAPWQQDFVGGVWGWALSLGLPLDAGYYDKAAAFFAWKSKFTIGRLGATDGYWYPNAAQYILRISPMRWPDYTTGSGNRDFYANWAEVYAANTALNAIGFGPITDTRLYQIGNDTVSAFPIATWSGTSYWGNLQPAIAYAVRHQVPGALEAYQRMRNAPNWANLQTSFNAAPVWSVKPAYNETPSIQVPAWATNAPLNAWISIPNTGGAANNCPRGIDAYGGWILREDTGELIAAAIGGHGDGRNNGVYTLNLLADAPTWITRTPSSDVTDANFLQGQPYQRDGKPTSRHTYNNNHWFPSLNRLILSGCLFVPDNAVAYGSVDGWNPSTNAYDPPGTWPNARDEAPGTHWDAIRNSWVNASGAPVLGIGGFNNMRASVQTANEAWGGNWERYRVGMGWDNPIAIKSTMTTMDRMCYDSVHNRLFAMRLGNYQDSPYDGTGVLTAQVINRADLTMRDITFTPSAAVTQIYTDKLGYHGMCHDPNNDCFWVYDGRNETLNPVARAQGRLFKVTPSSGTTWDISIHTYGSGGVIIPPTNTAGICSRMAYVTQLNGIVVQPNRDAGLYFMRTR